MKCVGKGGDLMVSYLVCFDKPLLPLIELHSAKT